MSSFARSRAVLEKRGLLIGERERERTVGCPKLNYTLAAGKPREEEDSSSLL